MDKILEEQITRMKRLNERLAQVHRGVTDANQAVARRREIDLRGPLHDVRDYRIVDSQKYDADAPTARPPARRAGKAASRSQKRRRT